jgi:hypothetical protein
VEPVTTLIVEPVGMEDAEIEVSENKGNVIGLFDTGPILVPVLLFEV